MILFRAIVVMLLAWVVGQGIAAVVKDVLDEQVKNYKKDNPLPQITGEDSKDKINQTSPSSGDV